MRSLLIAVGGGAATLLAFVVSQTASALAAAVAFMVGLALLALTVGITMARIVDALQTRRGTSGVGGRCGTCLEPMDRIEYVWMCPHCDGPLLVQ